MLAHQPARLALVVVGILAIALGATRASAQSTNPVAVVDMERVFVESAAAKAALEQMKLVFTEVNGRLEALAGEVRGLEQQIQQLAPGSERFLELNRVRALKQAELEAEQKFGTARVAMLRLQANLQVYSLAGQAIADVARQKNIGTVMRKAPPLPAGVTARTSVPEVEALIHQQVVLFVAPEYDITGDVLVRMDELVRTGAATQPAAGAQGTTRPAGA